MTFNIDRSDNDDNEHGDDHDLFYVLTVFVYIAYSATVAPPPATRPATTMRESNFAFPAQNRACVCISSQLYDRRGPYHLQNHLRPSYLEL